MANGLVTISARVPKKMYDQMQEIIEERGYASLTELLREMIRQEITKEVLSLRGALKGKVKMKESIPAMRRRMWRETLKKAGGDARKAAEIMEAEKNERLKASGLRL